jgi:hypothetical protein
MLALPPAFAVVLEHRTNCTPPWANEVASRVGVVAILKNTYAEFTESSHHAESWLTLINHVRALVQCRDPYRYKNVDAGRGERQ